MLSIRMKRIGRKGHPTYRVVVQDSRWAPTSGKFVATLGSYDPHSKVNSLNKEKAEFYLKNGARPSDRVVRLMQQEGVALPSWVKVSEGQKRETRNPDKLRKNRPAEEKPAEEVAPEAEAPASEEVTVAEEVPVEEVATEETPVASEEAPAEEPTEKA